VIRRTELTACSLRLTHFRNEHIRFKLFVSNVPEIEGQVMTELQYLQEQAARAERLSRSTLDPVTVERLNAFAAECREKAELERARTLKAA
jgi:hypothetical protein